MQNKKSHQGRSIVRKYISMYIKLIMSSLRDGLYIRICWMLANLASPEKLWTRTIGLWELVFMSLYERHLSKLERDTLSCLVLRIKFERAKLFPYIYIQSHEHILVLGAKVNKNTVSHLQVVCRLKL